MYIKDAHNCDPCQSNVATTDLSIMEFTLLTSVHPILIGADASCAVWKGKSTHLVFWAGTSFSLHIAEGGRPD